MKYIHPFPARMAPEIALEKVAELIPGQIVLDPMSGSGMVLAQAAKIGVKAIGYDLDPLARLISGVGSTDIDSKKVTNAASKLLRNSQDIINRKVNVVLPWIDSDEETKAFIDFWFAPKQITQLRALSMNLACMKNDKVSNLLRVAVSRLIITKDPKASLARDTAHSRPHRTIETNDFDIFGALEDSVARVLKALDPTSIHCNAQTYLGDARNMWRLQSESIDQIVTSPPYLNAIDYMRGHRLSLVWFGYNLNKLRILRSKNIGAEKMINKDRASNSLKLAVGEDTLNQMDIRTVGMLQRYFVDLQAQSKEALRVLKCGSIATYVIGNSNIKGKHVKNSEILKVAAMSSGFEVVGEVTRDIPDNRRYMPIPSDKLRAFGARMRTENVIEFRKPLS